MNGFSPVATKRLYTWLRQRPRQKLDLQVEVDRGSGFYFGVVYAVEMAEDILKEEGKLYCLGDIIHNDMEVERLEQMGLIIIDHGALGKLKNEKVLIRAHGEPPSTYRLAMENHLQLIDASCPVILKLQQRIRQSYEAGEHILIYGKKDHAEVIGLRGQTQDQAAAFLNPQELENKDLPVEVTIYSQNTKNKGRFREAVRQIEKMGSKVKAHDTICRQVSHRDQELREFVQRFDAVIFVAGRKSSNGKILFGVCRQANSRTHFASSVEDIRRESFGRGEKIGICGATSTPQWLMEEIKAEVESW